LYIFGGFDGFGPIDSIEKADLNSKEPTFTELARSSSLVSPLKNSACVEHKGKLLIIGGWDNRDTQDSIFVFDPVSEQSEFVAKLCTRVEGHTLAKFGNVVFVIGGFDSYGVSDRIIRLDLASMQSTVLDIKLKQKRENHTS
jgi:hypothetical protein